MSLHRRSCRSALRKVCRAAFDVLESRTLFTVAVPQAIPKIMPLGDSITQAFGGHASYRYWLWNELADAGYTVDLVGSQQPPGVGDGEPLFLNFDPHHEGHNGWTADEIAGMTQDQNWIDYTLQPQNNPDIVLLHIGTNDINHGETNATTIDDISNIIDGLRNVNPNVKILLAKIIPGDGIEAAAQDLNSLMPALVTSKTTVDSPITLIDQYTGIDVNNDLYDGVHPNNSGEQKIAQNWYNALTSLLPAPTAPAPGVYIDTLTPTNAGNGWGPVEYELSNGESNQFDGQMISLGGKKYMRGLGVNSDSDITYDITGKHYSNFLADIGLDDEVAENGTVHFKIVVDGNVLYDSGLLTGESDIQSINVAIPQGSQTLDLIVTDGGDDSSFDHADWANARVLVQATPKAEIPALSGQLNGQKVDLSWTEASNDVTKYHIERKTGSGGTYATLIDLTGATLATSYSDTTVLAGNTYYYRVSATNDGGTSDLSNEVNVAVPIPAAIPALSGQLNGAKIDLSWTDASNDITKYHIERKTGSGGTYGTLIDLTGATLATSYSDTTVLAGNTYYYRVSATNAVSTSSFSNVINVAVPVPSAIPVLSGQLNGAKIDLSWTDTSNDITKYHIERKTGSGGTYATLIDLTGATLATSYSDTTVLQGNTYYYRVSATNAVNTSNFSNEINVAVPVPQSPPAIPALSGQLNGAKIDLSWTDASNDITKYHIERKTGSGGTYATLIDLTGATLATNYSDTTVQGGNTYYYRVSATNAVSTSNFSNEVNVAVPLTKPAIPVLSGQLNGQQINLSWTESSQIVTGFRLERKIGVNGTYQQIADLTGPKTYGDSDIQVGNTYYYHVDAYNGAGTSDFSNEFSISYSTQNAVYLSDLNYVVNSNGYGPAEKDKSNGEAAAGDGNTLTLNGVTYAKGLGVHAGSEIVYNLNGQYTQFLSDIGIDDEKGNLGSVNFQVYLDNVIAFDSGKMTGSSATQSINLNVTGKTTLKLVVTNGGDNIDNDHGDWANARLVVGQAVPLPTDPTNLNASFNSGTNKIDLTWTDAANDETGFRIERKTGVNGTYSQIADLLLANLPILKFTDPNVSAGNTYYYHIYAYNAGSNSGLSNEANATYPVPAGSNYLSDLNYTVISNGYGPVEKDKSNAEQPGGDGRTITLNTVTYAKGLGVHAASEVDFNLNGLYTQFLSDIGVDDEVGTAGSVNFQVYLDNSNVPVFDSGKMTGSSLTQSININVTGKSLLRLVVTNSGDNNNFDHADWANARLVSGAPILPPATPANFNAQYNVNTNRVDLSWTDAANDATGFRIERKTGANGSYSLLADLTGATFALGYSDSTVSPGVTYSYHVYAYSNNGNSDLSGESTVQVPIVSGTVYLSDMPIVVNSNGYGAAELDHSNGEAGTGDGHTITLNGATFAKGLGVHAGSQITVSLNKQYTQFLANIGVDDEVGNNGSVVFQVWLDNVKVFDSGTMTGLSVTQSLNINVANKNTMQLIVTDSGNGNAYDHADWGNARLVAGQQILTPTAPNNVQAHLNGNQVDVSWSAGSNNQTGFRVQRKTGANGTWADLQTVGASTFSYSDTGPLANSTTYYYRVIAFNGIGDSQPSGEQPVTTNDPAIQVWVSDLTPTSSTNGWGSIEIDRSNGEAGTGDGHIMSIRGNTYLKGVGVHGLSQIAYSLGGQYKTFLSDIGVDDETGGKGTVVFQVYVDNVLKFDSGTVRGTDPVQQAIVDVTNGQTLTLVVTNANDGANYDHADWANAQLTA